MRSLKYFPWPAYLYQCELSDLLLQVEVGVKAQIDL